MSLTIREIKSLQEEFDRAHSGRNEFYESINECNLEALEHLIVCIMGELGEFSNIVKKVGRGDLALAEAKAQLDEEIIDIFIYLIKVTNQFDVDLEEGFLKKLSKNKQRFLRYKK